MPPDAQADAASSSAWTRVAGAAVEVAGRHAAVVLVAVVVALCMAASYLFRARATSVPVSVQSSTASPVVVTSGADPSTVGSTDPGGQGASSASSSVAGSPAGSVVGSGVVSASASPTTPATVTVQVLGPVRHPGVVTLPAGARVQDALTACGGLLTAAGVAELNLAAVLQDADQVIIGTTTHPRGEVRPGSGVSQMSTASGGTPVGTTTGAASSAASSVAVVDLNTATAADLDALPGVGPTMAQRILDWRAQHGRFTSVSELQEVDGIGPKTYAKLASHVRV